MAITKLIDFPEVRQAFNFDCGVACLLAILRYYGHERYEADLVKSLKIDPELGIDIKKIVRVAKLFKLDAEYTTKLSIDDLKKTIDNNYPVIVLIEAWPSEDVDWKTDYAHGHYVVLIGYTSDDKFIFEDPFLFERGFMPITEFMDRWHGLDDDNKPEQHSAIIIKGKPQFTGKKAVHMEAKKKIDIKKIIREEVKKIKLSELVKWDVDDSYSYSELVNMKEPVLREVDDFAKLLNIDKHKAFVTQTNFGKVIEFPKTMSNLRIRVSREALSELSKTSRWFEVDVSTIRIAVR